MNYEVLKDELGKEEQEIEVVQALKREIEISKEKHFLRMIKLEDMFEEKRKKILGENLSEMAGETLEHFKTIFDELCRKHEIEILKIKEELLSENITNSRLKNEVLAAEAEILELSSFTKQTVSQATSGNMEIDRIRYSYSGEIKYQSFHHSLSIKNLNSNLEQLKEQITDLQIKTQRSYQKLESYKKEYGSQILTLSESLSSIYSKIESLKSETNLEISKISAIKSKNSSVSLFISRKRRVLEKLKHKNSNLKSIYQKLKQQVIKKHLI